MPSRLLLLTFVVALFATGCSATTGSVPATAAATVGDEKIPVELLERIIEAAKENPNAGMAGLEGDALAERTATLEREILTSLIRIELTRQAVEERDVEVTDEMIDEEYENQIELAGGEEALEQQAESFGLTTDEYREILVGNVVRETALRDAILGDNEMSDDDLREIYDQRNEAGLYNVGTVSHILVETEEEANEIIGLLEDGGDFAALAEERSQDPGSAAQGGSLGEAPFSNYVPEFAEAAEQAEVGEIVGPVESQFGFHVIRVDERREVEFEDVQDDLRNELQNQQGETQFQNELRALFTETEIDVNSRFGMWDPETGTVVADAPTDN